MGLLEMRDPRPLLSIIYCPHHTGALTLNFSSLAASLNSGQWMAVRGCMYTQNSIKMCVTLGVCLCVCIFLTTGSIVFIWVSE